MHSSSVRAAAALQFCLSFLGGGRKGLLDSVETA